MERIVPKGAKRHVGSGLAAVRDNLPSLGGSEDGKSTSAPDKTEEVLPAALPERVGSSLQASDLKLPGSVEEAMARRDAAGLRRSLSFVK